LAKKKEHLKNVPRLNFLGNEKGKIEKKGRENKAKRRAKRTKEKERTLEWKFKIKILIGLQKDN